MYHLPGSGPLVRTPHLDEMSYYDIEHWEAQLTHLIVFTIGAGMLYLLKVDSPSAKWIGYQILSGIGGGAAVQIPFIAVQVVLDQKDMPVGSKLLLQLYN